MKILVISQYFWPENFRVNDLVEELCRRGHEVTVLTGLPNYPSGQIMPDYRNAPGNYTRYQGADIYRVWLMPRGSGNVRLALNYLSFALACSLLGPLKLRGRSFDAAFVFEPSPITVGIPALMLKWLKNLPISIWVLDLWPHSLEAVGAVKSRLVLGAVDKMVRTIYRGFDLIFAQSRGFAEEISLQVSDGEKDKIVYFPSWAEPAVPFREVEPASEIPQRPDLFTIVFTGNIGEAQDFGAVLEAARLLRDQPVRWVIVGDGRKFAWLKRQIQNLGLEDTVITPGRYPLDRMPSFFRHADALLVCLRDEKSFALTLPGKLQSYLAAGLPILCMMNGEGARVVTESGGGLAVPAGHSASLAHAVGHMMAMSSAERANMGRRGAEYALREFDREALIDRLIDHLQAISTKNAKSRS